MCECRHLLAHGWWSEDGDYEAEHQRGWQNIGVFAWGWACLWQCRECGKLWQGVVRDAGDGRTDYIEWWPDSPEKWWADTKRRYDEYVGDDRVLHRAYEVAARWEKEGQTTHVEPMYGPRRLVVPWQYFVWCERRVLWMRAERVYRLTLTCNGGVAVNLMRDPAGRP